MLTHLKLNIYFQRHSTVAPGPACPNPAAKTIVRCALFRSPMNVNQATNYGQLRGPSDSNGDKFEALMRSSNGMSPKYSLASFVNVVVLILCSLQPRLPPQRHRHGHFYRRCYYHHHHHGHQHCHRDCPRLDAVYALSFLTWRYWREAVGV